MKLELVVPDALVDGRLARFAYLAATVAALALVRRATDSTIPREVSLSPLVIVSLQLLLSTINTNVLVMLSLC